MTNVPATSAPTASPNATGDTGSFTDEQKEYLAGFLAGAAQAYVGALPDGRFTSDSASGGTNLAAPREETIHGTPLADLTKQERWKHE